MKIQIVYFSGTGNTKVIAKVYQELFEKGNHAVRCDSIEDKAKIEDVDLLIVGGPIYAGNMPDELLNWVRKNVPNSENRKAIVYSTSAGLQNAHGVKSLGKKLQKKGYKVIDQVAFEMPRNFYVDKYEPTPLEEQERQFSQMLTLVRKSVDQLDMHTSIDFNDSVIAIDFFADLFRMMAKQMGKSFKITEGCINCGLCEKQCPKSNITAATKAYANKCMLCTRCIHNCPVNAITYKGRSIDQYHPLPVSVID